MDKEILGAIGNVAYLWFKVLVVAVLLGAVAFNYKIARNIGRK